jgi:aryl-alcohol dehydrogenase-like predicted oxidoreductase
MGDRPNERRLSAYHIKRACEESLRRMQTDHIDLYQMHHIDRETPWEEIWQAMEQLVREGKVLYVGSSNFAGWHIAQAQGEAKARNFMGLVSEQSLYNLADRMSPLSGGILGGALAKAKEGRRSSKNQQELIVKYEQHLKDYEGFCKQLGEQPADVALAWLLNNPDVTGPIIGPRTMEQLEGSMRVFDVKLTKKDMEKLDEIWPGPGGEAPEAYAW